MLKLVTFMVLLKCNVVLRECAQLCTYFACHLVMMIYIYLHITYCLEQLERLLLGFELDYLATGAAIDTMEKVIYQIIRTVSIRILQELVNYKSTIQIFHSSYMHC